MVKFDRDKVLLLHQIMTAETGGSAGVRDYGMLDSALNGAFQTFDGKELYPTKQEKAARIGHSLVTNHAFVDGNKRIGLHVCLAFLNVNGINVDPDDDEIIRVGIELASGKMSYDDLLNWIKLNQKV